jgi:hypothetical protein
VTDDFAGQPGLDAQFEVAGEPGGQSSDDALGYRAARRKPIAGQLPPDDQAQFAGNDADLGQLGPDAQPGRAGVRATINEVISTSRDNQFAIRQRMRLNQATLSYIARVHFGYHTGLEAAARKKAMDAAGKLIKSITAGEPHESAQLVLATGAASEPWERIERDTEKAMVKLARKLPAYEWAKSVRGFGDLSFARIIAETGDLSLYANPGKVWKRMGVAPGQRKMRDAEKAKEAGYSPRRRSVLFVAFEPVIRAQSAPKESGGQLAHDDHGMIAAGANGAGQLACDAHMTVAGPYRRLYDAKKAEYLARGEAGEKEWTRLHADRAAKRYASKRLLRDLWSAWRVVDERT